MVPQSDATALHLLHVYGNLSKQVTYLLLMIIFL